MGLDGPEDDLLARYENNVEIIWRFIHFWSWDVRFIRKVTQYNDTHVLFFCNNFEKSVSKEWLVPWLFPRLPLAKRASTNLVNKQIVLYDAVLTRS